MKSYFYLIGWISLLVGCEKSTFTTYNAGNYIQFSKPVDDSTRISFTFYPGEDEVRLPLSVEISSLAPEKDQAFKLSVDEKHSTAIAGKHFVLPDKMLIRAGHVIDTCWLTLKRTSDMKTTEFKIVLRLESNEYFGQGQLENILAFIRVNDKISQPDWWNDAIIQYYLGNYSDKKYTLFIEKTGIADLSNKPDAEIRTYCLKFKYWLESEKKAGNTIREEDLTEMIVPIIG